LLKPPQFSSHLLYVKEQFYS